MSSHAGVETLEPMSEEATDPVLAVPTLTIAFHADVTRVGQSVVVGRQPMDVSRHAPNFGGAPLDDPYMSRQPLRIEPVADGFDLIPTAGRYATVGGEPLAGRRRVSLAAVRDGVVIGLARRVVLILHNAPVGDAAPDFGLVGGSAAIERVRRAIARVADLDVPVLIRGETGAGKECVAQALHAASDRRRRACVAVNMAAIAPTTAASELFGHTRGAFTGAATAHEGLFARADGGTLFLDEVGDTPTDVQAMLLRALETRQVLPVGATDPRAVDVRIVAATDVDLEESGARGAFRFALLHRLAGFEIAVPPLRERRVDIALLLVHFLQRELAALGESDRLRRDPTEPSWISPPLFARLCAHDWPGNVRQLANVVRQLVIASRGSDRARVDTAVTRLLRAPEPDAASAVASDVDAAPIDDARVEAAMRQHNWALGPTAKELGIPRSTLYDLIDRHPRLRIAKDVPDAELAAEFTACAGDLDRMVEQLQVSKRGLRIRLQDVRPG